MKASINKALFYLTIFILSASGIYAQESNQELKQKFQKMNNEFTKAILNENNDAILAMYVDDAISLPSYEPMIKGKSAMKKKMEMDENSGFKMTDFKLTTMEVFNSGDYAYEVGSYELSMEAEGAPESWTDNGKYLTVYEKQADGSWKVKAETWNTNNNPWQQMEEQSEMMQDKETEKMDQKKNYDDDKMHTEKEKMEDHSDLEEKHEMEDDSDMDDHSDLE